MQAPEADYRTISQEYAKGAINAAILINGGSAVAVLSQMTNLAGAISNCTLAAAMLLFACGVLFGLISWVLGFMSTRHVDRTLRGQDADYSKADCYMTAGLLCIGVCCFVFLLGATVLAVGFIRA